MKKKWKIIFGAVIAVGVITAGVLYFMDWGNAESEVEESDADTSKKLENMSGTFISSNDPAKHEILFTIDGPKSATGKFEDFSATLEMKDGLDEAKLTVTIDPASVNTENSTRDDHLRESDFFHVEEHPKIVFTSTELVSEGEENSYRAKGKLNFLGKEWDYEFPFVYRGAGTTEEGKTFVSFKGEFSFKTEEHGMPSNPGVGDVAEVSFYVDMIKGGDSASSDQKDKQAEKKEKKSKPFPEYEKDDYDKIFDQIEAEAEVATP